MLPNDPICYDMRVETNYHRRFLKQLNVPTNVQAYIQSGC